MRGWLALGALTAGCVDPGSTPTLEAHRAGAGYWPENSRSAVEGAVELGVAGLEVDLGLTADQVPVLWHDVRLTSERCTKADGTHIIHSVLIKTRTLQELQEGWLCGGIPDPEFPNAIVAADILMTLDDLLKDLQDADPDMRVHLDLKWEPNGLTWSAERFATQIVDRWFAADPPQPFYVSSVYPEMLDAIDAQARAWATEIPGMLIWPHFPEGQSTGSVALTAERDQLFGTTDYVRIAEQAGAQGLTLQWEVADRHLVNAAVAEGVAIQLWTVNDPDAIDLLSRRWNAEILITDFPGESP